MRTISGKQKEPCHLGLSASRSPQPKTFILGFSKGGTVLNQLVTELGYSKVQSTGNSLHVKEPDPQEECQMLPNSKESLLNSITEVHYVDVGLNSSGAHITDHDIISRISKRLAEGAGGIRFVVHGTPRQWCDKRRAWIRSEKDKFVHLLESEAEHSEGKLQVCERFYFPDQPPNLPMHFEIIDYLDVS